MRSRHSPLTSLLLTGLLAAPVLSAAQEAQDFEGILSLSLEDLLQIPIYSSTLSDETLKTVPSSVTVFTQQQIQSLGIDYLHELINYVPGFQSFRQEESSDEYYHSSRGHRSSTSSREVLILIDGQRFNREFDNAIGAPMLALGNIEKVEFIRGPGSSIYGSNAFTGVISVTTTKNKNETRLSYGTNNNTHGQILASTHFNALSVDAYINTYSDKGEPYQLQDIATHIPHDANDPRKGYDLNLKLGWDKAQINLLHFERQANDFYVLGQISNNVNETRNEYSSIQFLNSFYVSSHLKTNYSFRYYQDDYQAEAVSFELGQVDFYQKEQNLEFKLHNDWSINATQNMIVGFEYRQSKSDDVNINAAALGSDILYKKQTSNILGLYTQYQHQLLDSTELTLGLRFDDYSHIGSALSPRFGLVHQISATQTIKLLYGEAFRAPTINELKLNNIFGIASLVGNSNLNPETIKTYELVWMGNWQQHSLAISVFNNTIENAIVRTETSSPATFVNTSDIEASHGAEIEYMVQLSNDWQLRSNYSWFDNLSRSDIRQADILATMILNYHQQQWNVNISSNYTAARSMQMGTKEAKLDDYWLLNGKLQYDFNNKQTIYLQAKNLLDTHYETPTQRLAFTEGTPNRGREIEMGLRWSFD